jgi:hypothetical protein
MADMFEPPVPLDGTEGRCRGGEFFRKVECVSSFDGADELVQKYAQM